MELERYLPRYRIALRSRGQRPRGIARYEQQVAYLLLHLGPGATVDALTEETIAAYQDRIARTWADNTVLNALTAIRSFCKQLRRWKVLDHDPTADLDWPKRRKHAPRPLTRAELRQLNALLEARPGDDLWMLARNKRVIYLMLYAGLRIAEVAALDWVDVDLDAGLLTVRDGKGGKDRTIPLHPVLAAELALIASRTGAVAGRRDRKRLGYKSLNHLFDRWLPKRGLKITAHRLRHSFATEILRNGGRLEEVQELLGHESPETTRIYTLIDGERLRCAVDRLPSKW